MDEVLNMKKRDNLRSIFIGIAILGILVLVAGIILSFKSIYLDIRNKKRTDAYVEVQNKSRIKVKYNVGNKTYKKSFFVYNKKYRSNEKVKIYYSPTNPYNALISSIRYYPLFLILLGFLIQGISGIGLIYVYMKYYNRYRPLSIN